MNDVQWGGGEMLYRNVHFCKNKYFLLKACFVVSVCSFYVQCMFILCTVYVHSMYSVCLPTCMAVGPIA